MPTHFNNSGNVQIGKALETTTGDWKKARFDAIGSLFSGRLTGTVPNFSLVNK